MRVAQRQHQRLRQASNQNPNEPTLEHQRIDFVEKDSEQQKQVEVKSMHDETLLAKARWRMRLGNPVKSTDSDGNETVS